MSLELNNDNIDASKGCVCHDDAVSNQRAHEHLLRALRSVAHREYELQADEEDASVSQNDKDVFA